MNTFLAGGGEMGERTRGKDWSSSALGLIDTWPQSLRSTLSMLLPSKAQIVLFWGPEFVVFYNDAYRPVFGAKHPQALGLPGREAWSEIWDGMLHGLLAGVVRTGEAFWARDLLFVIERHGRPEETFFDVSYDPVRDESGAVGGVYCIVTETTGRVVGERRLALLKDLAANTTARTVRDACRLTMETLAAKPQDVAFALAFLGHELQGSTPGAESALASASHECVKTVPLASPAGGGRLVVGLNPQRPFDDQYRSFVALVAGQLETAIANAQAYEDEKKRSEALAEVDRAKTAFFSNVSHEFRTPLTLMLGPVEELLAKETGESRELLAIVHRNGQRLLKLVNTLLDFARIEAGRADARFEPTDLGALTADLASNFRAACEKAGLELRVQCPALTEPAYIDREMWEKIVLNLLSNAFKFTLAGSIEVRLQDAGERLRLTVHDTGIGIPRESLARVFDRFHRIEGARGRSHEGSGIGLALVQELVRLQGGTIGVECEPGAGTTFTVEIPKGNGHLPHEQPVPRSVIGVGGLRADAYVAEALGWLRDDTGKRPAVLTRAAGTARVLLADDNADLREYAARLLGDEYEVETVADGRAALEAARARRPDLVISDVMMPGLDGFGLIRELRADPALSTVPVILLSARAGEEARLDGLHHGADDYLVKPFSARELLVRTGALLHSQELRRGALEALRDAGRRKDEFLATLAHELRNPLAPLRNALHVMRLGTSDEATLASAREIMERQVEHLVRLVDDLMEVARISRGALELRRERVELGGIVRDALEASGPLIHAARHRLELALSDESLWLEGDPVRLIQIVTNVLNNAAKYTPQGGMIAVQASREGAQATITVRDNGVGIARDALTRIFEMFSREESPGDRAQGGLGIGLALSRRLAEMHGGTLEAKSAGLARGSEFILRLPLAVAQAAVVAAAAQVPNTLFAMRILVVDDNRDAAESLSMVLRTLGAQVQMAHDGPTAIEAFRGWEPTAVLLDIGMPGMDGYEVASALRNGFPDRRVTLVALSGWGQKEDRRRAREAGFDHHIVKPAEIDALQALLGEIAREQTRRRSA